MPDSIPDGSRRQEYIDGLRELANFLAANPDVPDNGGHGDSVQYSVSLWFPGEPEGVAEVDRVAKELDVEPYWRADRSGYKAERNFGPHRYIAIWIRREIKEASK